MAEIDAGAFRDFAIMRYGKFLGNAEFALEKAAFGVQRHAAVTDKDAPTSATTVTTATNAVLEVCKTSRDVGAADAYLTTADGVPQRVVGTYHRDELRAMLVLRRTPLIHWLQKLCEELRNQTDVSEFFQFTP